MSNYGTPGEVLTLDFLSVMGEEMLILTERNFPCGLWARPSGTGSDLLWLVRSRSPDQPHAGR